MTERNYIDSNVVEHPDRSRLLKDRGGGGTYDGMERIARLEARADMADSRLTRIEGKIDKVLEKLGGMPTTNGLWGIGALAIVYALRFFPIK